MAEDDWSRRGIDRGGSIDREVDRLKHVYAEHAETLSRLASTAPSRLLARRYQELIAEVNKAIVGLDDVDPALLAKKTIDRAMPAQPEAKPPQPPPPGEKPKPSPLQGTYAFTSGQTDTDDGAGLRIAMMIGLAVVLIAILAFFVWKYSSSRPAEPATETAVATTSPETATVAPAPALLEAPLRITPQAQDFGIVKKGTRAVRGYEIENRSARAITLEVARSRCRCLWFDYPKTLAAGGKGTMSVAVDGTRAAPGLLSESIEVSVKGESDMVAVFEVNAEVK